MSVDLIDSAVYKHPVLLVDGRLWNGEMEEDELGTEAVGFICEEPLFLSFKQAEAKNVGVSLLKS